MTKMAHGFSLEKFVEDALAEDIREGDHTSLACISKDETGTAELIVKERGILAGVSVALAVFRQYDPELSVEVLLSDGTVVEPGQRAFYVHGKLRSILGTERLVLNLMQRMSGIATTTASYVEKIKGTGARVLDTRKTTPLLRWFEKEAVKIGGGYNHRFGLFDMILVKDNHIDGAGSVKAALDRVHDYLTYKNLDLRIELEVRNFNELTEALEHGGMDRLMLDNFNAEETRKAVQMINKRFEVESSGGITLDTIRPYAEAGVDFISVGALTHSVKSLDLSLKIKL